jgi:Sigma-70, region 4
LLSAFFWTWTTAHEFALRRLVSRVARSAFPFVRLEKIVFIALVVSLITAMEEQNMFQQRSGECWKKLESCGSWFHDFIVKSRVANELSG